MFAIKFTPEAIEDLRLYTKREQKRILDATDACLRHEPSRETRNNKRLRPNRLAEWELRVDRFRVFYDIDGVSNWVKIAAVGHKSGNCLYVHGEEFQL